MAGRPALHPAARRHVPRQPGAGVPGGQFERGRGRGVLRRQRRRTSRSLRGERRQRVRGGRRGAPGSALRERRSRAFPARLPGAPSSVREWVLRGAGGLERRRASRSVRRAASGRASLRPHAPKLSPGKRRHRSLSGRHAREGAGAGKGRDGDLRGVGRLRPRRPTRFDRRGGVDADPRVPPGRWAFRGPHGRSRARWNGTLEQILTFYKHGVSYPVAGRDELISLIPRLRDRYATYAAFGAARVEDILPAGELAQATLREARMLASSVALNNGNGTFTLAPLPAEAQFAPIRAVLVGDFDGDGRPDLLVGGNLYGVPPVLGRYDASYGLLLSGMGDGRFSSVDMERSGLMIEGQVRHIGWLGQADGKRLIVVARNDDKLQVLRPLRSSPH